MQFECSAATGKTSSAVQVTSRFGVGAAAAATSLLTAEHCVRQWCSSLIHPMLKHQVDSFN